ncbi:MAG: ATP-binding protein [Candidatus Latescibacteria bacterium]|nr:ATP-binding protein [Candidatus Latescibacterota bacterium]
MSQAARRPETISLTVPSHPKYLSVIRRIVEACARDLRFVDEDTRRLVLAVDEACSNVIKYAYDGDVTQSIIVEFTCIGDRLTITIRDFGKKPDVEKIAPRDLADIRPGGLGTHFIRSIMDEVTYDTSPAVGTALTLVKYSSKPE